MPVFKCDKCGFEIDFDEDETEMIECWNYGCDGTMWFKGRKDW